MRTDEELAKKLKVREEAMVRGEWGGEFNSSPGTNVKTSENIRNFRHVPASTEYQIELRRAGAMLHSSSFDEHISFQFQSGTERDGQRDGSSERQWNHSIQRWNS